MGRRKLHKTPEARREARSRSNAMHYAKHKSQILSKGKERYDARRTDDSRRPNMIVRTPSTSFIRASRSDALSVLDLADIQATLAQLNAYLGDGGLSAYADSLSKDVKEHPSEASEMLLTEMDNLRELRDRAHDTCIELWERDGASRIWEKSRHLLRPFQEAIDAVDSLYDRSIALMED